MTPTESSMGTEAGGLASLFDPGAIAVVGASGRPGHFANQPLVNLRRFGFPGTVYPVNPRNDEVHGYRCYARLSDLPAVPDLAIVVVRPNLAIQAVRECGELGVGSAVVVGSGFAETGTATGRELQQELADVVAQTGIRVCGPNTLGVANFYSGAVSYASGNLPPEARLGPVAVVSQSGGCSFTLLNRAWRNGIGVGHVAVAGNELDISIPDLVIAYLQRQEVRSVACYMEAIRDPEGLRRVGEFSAAVGKPVFVMKSGISESGQRAAAAHTGALATSDAVCDAALRQWGLGRARTFDELIDAAALAARFGPARDQRFGVYAQGGGLAVVASDLFEEAGLELARLSSATVASLKSRMPDTTPGNPFDSGGQFLSEGAHVLTEALTEFTNDPQVSAVVYMLMPVAGMRLVVYTEGIVGAAKQSEKPTVVLQYGAGAITQDSTNQILDANILLLDPPEAGIAALRLWADSATTARGPVQRRSDVAAVGQARALIARWRQAGRQTVSEHDAGQLLEMYGIRLVRQELVTDAAAVPAAAARLEPPYVVKVASDDLPHKSDIGGVLMGVGDASAAVQAYRTVMASVRSARPDATIQGVTVCETAAEGVELIVGIVRDATFGSAIMVGVGGVYAEVWKDTALRLPPFDQGAARTMIDELRGAPLLHGTRGLAGADLPALTDLLVRVGELAGDLGEELASFEMNPVIVGAAGQSVVAVDALLELAAE